MAFPRIFAPATSRCRPGSRLADGCSRRRAVRGMRRIPSSIHRFRGGACILPVAARRCAWCITSAAKRAYSSRRHARSDERRVEGDVDGVRSARHEGPRGVARVAGKPLECKLFRPIACRHQLLGTLPRPRRRRGPMRATIQLCTYNRSALLSGSSTRASNRRRRATTTRSCSSTMVRPTTRPPSSNERAPARPAPSSLSISRIRDLAKGRNAGIAHASGERIIFIDDDVLPLPNFVEEHLRTQDAHPPAIVRGGAINVESFDDLPVPLWTIKDYSGNYFWTTNVSVPLATIREIRGFNESFSEYGWRTSTSACVCAFAERKRSSIRRRSSITGSRARAAVTSRR